MRNKACGNGSKNCVVFRNAMRNGIKIGNPTFRSKDALSYVANKNLKKC